MNFAPDAKNEYNLTGRAGSTAGNQWPALDRLDDD